MLGWVEPYCLLEAPGKAALLYRGMGEWGAHEHLDSQ